MKRSSKSLILCTGIYLALKKAFILNKIGRLVYFLVVIVPGLAVAQGDGARIIEVLNERYRSAGKMGSNETFVSTRYPNAYAVQESGAKGSSTRSLNYAPRYVLVTNNFGDEITSVNLDTRGAASSVSNLALLQSINRQRNSKHLEYLPLDRFIRVNARVRPSLVIYSAPDCPVCVTLERELRRENIGYYVVPTWLNENNATVVKSVYCSEASGTAWERMMERTPINLPTRIGCEFFTQDFMDVRYVFGIDKTRTSTPMVIFPDGDVLIGYSSERDKVKLLEKSRTGSYFP